MSTVDERLAALEAQAEQFEMKAAQFDAIAGVFASVDEHRNRSVREAFGAVKMIVAGDMPATIAVSVTDGGGESEAVDLESLKVSDLKAFATERGIDIGAATKKNEIIAAIEAFIEVEGEQDEEPDMAGWHALVTAPDGTVIYDGLVPIPEELITITPEMLANGETFNFELTPPDES